MESFENGALILAIEKENCVNALDQVQAEGDSNLLSHSESWDCEHRKSNTCQFNNNCGERSQSTSSTFIGIGLGRSRNGERPPAKECEDKGKQTQSVSLVMVEESKGTGGNMALKQQQSDPWESVRHLVVGEIFLIGDRISAGAYGKVFNATCTMTGESVAVKLEDRYKNNYLEHESRILWNVSSIQSGFPRWRYFGSEGPFNVLVMDKLGSSLSSLLASCNGIFTLKTTLMLADQCLLRLQSLHECGYVHSDIKPENYVMGIGQFDSNAVYLIDFGLSKSYKNVTTKHHLRQKPGGSFNGTVRYASINTHQGLDPSRRDDLESLGYMLIQFIKRKLPWSGLQIDANESLFEKVLQVKLDNPVEKLCADLPKCFTEYMRYCRGLGFKETPDYNHLRSIFMAEMAFQNYFYDYQYDWATTAGPVYPSVSASGLGPAPSNGVNVAMMDGINYPLPQNYRFYCYPTFGF
ncbi:unnamed protein product [Orchesella dallaii]|uniref:non-specific serine/threonine protein kinase n=1 Tax=Orchesella dallaii TaxID=48710 RepID=A0ABP1R0X7_9HEXA